MSMPEATDLLQWSSAVRKDQKKTETGDTAEAHIVLFFGYFLPLGPISNVAPIFHNQDVVLQ